MDVQAVSALLAALLILAIGLGNTTWNGQPLPLELTNYGLPGCRHYTSADATLALAKRSVVLQVAGRDLASSVDSSNTSDAARSFSSEATAEG